MQPYLGQVATNCQVPTNANQSYNAMMSRTRHIMKDDVSQLQLSFANWNVASSAQPGPTAGYGGVEHTNGGSMAIRASIEYPVGTIRGVLFSGGREGSIPDGGTILSDVCDIDIPKGAVFFVRSYQLGAAGVVWTDGQDAAGGEACNYGTSANVPDQTRGGQVVDMQNGAAQANTFTYKPVAIVAPTTRKSIVLFGDSRAFGYQDTYSDTSTGRGSLGRSIIDNMALINASCSGDRADWFNRYGTRRLALAQYASHIICEYGANDMNGGAMTATQIEAILQQIYAKFQASFPGKPFAQATLEPYTSSSDGWTTAAGQSPMPSEAQRVALNDAIRAGLGQGFTIDMADAFETGRNSGKWRFGWPDGPLTPDGLHAGYAGTTFFKNIFHLNPALFQDY